MFQFVSHAFLPSFVSLWSDLDIFFGPIIFRTVLFSRVQSVKTSRKFYFDDCIFLFYKFPLSSSGGKKTLPEHMSKLKFMSGNFKI